MAQTDTTSIKPFRVIVVGAGFVGLALSHALQLANIEHVVLEKYDQVKSVKGAAVIIWPSVERIFDQFGFLSKILSTVTPVETEYRRWPDGTVNACRSTMHRVQQLYVHTHMCLITKSAERVFSNTYTVIDLAFRPFFLTGSSASLTSTTTCLINRQSN